MSERDTELGGAGGADHGGVAGSGGGSGGGGGATGWPAGLDAVLRRMSDRLDAMDGRLAALERAQGFADAGEPSAVEESVEDGGQAGVEADEREAGGSAPDQNPWVNDPAARLAERVHAARAIDWRAHDDDPHGAHASKAEEKSDSALQPERVRHPISRPKFDAAKFEWLLGARGLALAGVITVVVGVAMFLKMAYDQGWIGQLPPMVRCGGAAAFGLAMIAVGEVLRRRINALASSGISAAGIAVVYASILAAHKMFGLADAPTAFAMLACATMGGIWLGALSNRVLLSALSLGGAFLAPLLLTTNQPSTVAMPMYLGALLTMGMALSAWRGGGYALIRRLAWGGTGLFGTVWIALTMGHSPMSVLAFVAYCWAITVVELMLSVRFLAAMRPRVSWGEASRTGFTTGEDGEVRINAAAVFSREALWLTTLFGVTAWAITASILALRQIDPALDALAPMTLGLLSVSGAAVFMWRGGLGKLWPRVTTPGSALAAALSINGTLMLVATIATALGGWAQVVAWLFVGLAAIETARRVRFRAVGVFGMVMIGVAVARLLILDSERMLSTEGVELGGLVFTAWSLQLLLAALVCVVGAVRTRGSYSDERGVLACAAPWLLSLAMVHDESSPMIAGMIAAVIGALTAWLTVFARAKGLRVNAIVLTSVGTLFAIGGQIDPEGSFEIVPLILLMTAACWSAIAGLPGAAIQLRTTGAGAAVTLVALAIGRIGQVWGADELLLAYCGYALLLLAAGRTLVRYAVGEMGAAGAVLIAVAWGWIMAERGGAVAEGTPIVHLAFAVSAAAFALLAWSWRRVPRLPAVDDAMEGHDEFRRQLGLLAVGTAVALLLATTSIEAARIARSLFTDETARSAALSIWWSVFATSAIAVGLRTVPAVRWFGLTLLGVASIKVLLVDTVTLEPMARVVAAITVGLITIGAGVLYARLVSGKPSPDDDDRSVAQRTDTDGDGSA